MLPILPGLTRKGPSQGALELNVAMRRSKSRARPVQPRCLKSTVEEGELLLMGASIGAGGQASVRPLRKILGKLAPEEL